MRVFPNGSMEARIDERDYIWTTPIERVYTSPIIIDEYRITPSDTHPDGYSSSSVTLIGESIEERIRKEQLDMDATKEDDHCEDGHEDYEHDADDEGQEHQDDTEDEDGNKYRRRKVRRSSLMNGFW
jgi:hypothetical protein